MRPVANPGRIAGLWYLLLVLLGPLRLLYIPGKLFVAGNAAATIDNIAHNEMLFRLGMVSDLACAILLILLTLALYRLLQGVGRYAAALVVILGGVMPATLDFVSVGFDVTTLSIIKGAGFLSVFDTPQRDALAMLVLHMRDQATTATELLWGLWLLPLAWLVYRSRVAPWWIGVWLALNGLAYVVISLTGLLAPTHQAAVFAASKPFLLGEVAIMLWLLIRGAQPTGDRRGREAAGRFDHGEPHGVGRTAS